MSEGLTIRPIADGSGLVDYSEGDVVRLENEALRRSTMLLREKLGSAAAIELLRDEIDEGDAFWTRCVEEAAGEWKEIKGFEIEVMGFDPSSWFDWISTNLDDETMHFSVHPEHYAWTSTAKLGEDPSLGSHVIVEPMGDYMLRLYVRDHEWEGMKELYDDDFPDRRGTELALRNGVVVGKSVGQTKQVEDGFRFRFKVLKPATVPDRVLGSMDHGFLEYVRYMERAYAGTPR